MIKVVGIDASLTSTGVAVWTGTELHTQSIKSKQRGCARLIELRDTLRGIVIHADLVVLENYAFARPNQAHQIGELGGVIRVMLHEEGVKWVQVSPAQVKKFAAGRGNATKEHIAAHVQRQWGRIFHTNDETDAFVLVQIGRAYMGDTDKELYGYQVDVLNTVKSGRPGKVQRKKGEPE
jgi:crossover junction endodeoxyribonuclease RuvC